MPEVVVTDEFKTWYEALLMDEQMRVLESWLFSKAVGCR